MLERFKVQASPFATRRKCRSSERTAEDPEHGIRNTGRRELRDSELGTWNLKQRNASRKYFAHVLPSAVLFFCLACGKADSPKPPPPDVQVVQVEQKDVPIWNEWIGTLDGLVNAQIKPQVTGYSSSPNLYGRFFRKKGPGALRNRSAHFSGGAGSGQGATRQCGRAARHCPGKPGQDATRRKSLYPARQRASHSPTGSRQCGAGE